jgi:hypothetical protein
MKETQQRETRQKRGVSGETVRSGTEIEGKLQQVKQYLKGDAIVAPMGRESDVRETRRKERKREARREETKQERDKS